MGRCLSHRTFDGRLLNLTGLPCHCFHCNILLLFRNLLRVSVQKEHRDTRAWCSGLIHLPTWVSFPRNLYSNHVGLVPSKNLTLPASPSPP